MATYKVPKAIQKVSPKYNTPINQEKEYFINFLEWASKNRDQIRKFSIVSNGTNTLYTIPQGFRFFLTHVSLMVWGTAAGDNGSGVIRGGNLGGTNDDLLNLRAYGTTSQNQSISFNHPIRLNAGETIFISSGSATLFCYGGFSGFLEPVSSS